MPPSHSARVGPRPPVTLPPAATDSSNAKVSINTKPGYVGLSFSRVAGKLFNSVFKHRLKLIQIQVPCATLRSSIKLNLIISSWLLRYLGNLSITTPNLEDYVFAIWWTRNHLFQFDHFGFGSKKVINFPSAL